MSARERHVAYQRIAGWEWQAGRAYQCGNLVLADRLMERAARLLARVRGAR